MGRRITQNLGGVPKMGGGLKLREGAPKQGSPPKFGGGPQN